MSTLIEVTQADDVAELRFNRPEALNALNVAMAEAFAAEIEHLLRDESLRVLLITGAGRVFKVAASPDCGGSFWLARLVGWRRAMQIALLSETLSASQAFDWGLVTQLTEAADLLVAARSLALRLSQGPQGSYAAMKRLFRSAAVNSFEEQLHMERESFAALSEQADFGRALEGFFAGKTRAGVAR
jgi:enoyl-CoA hydratase/carnithine racemase